MTTQPDQTTYWARRFIQGGIILIVGVMPFHAFFTTWLGSVVGYRGLWQSWKELLIAMMVGCLVWLMWKVPAYRSIWQEPWVKAASFFAGIAVVVSFVAIFNQTSTFWPVVYGLKIDLEFWVIAVLALSVSSSKLITKAISVTLTAGLVVSIFVVLQAYVLPPDWLTQFGYGPTTIPPFLYLTATSDTLRFAGTLGGPNQLGTYLVIIIALSIIQIVRHPLIIGGLGLNFLALWNSYSRSAWLAALVTLPLIWLHIAHRHRRLAALGGAAFILAAMIATTVLINKYPALQESILHSTAAHHQNAASSDSLRLTSIQEGAQAVLTSPLGHGLGSAGPATFQLAEPLIIENQFLQIGYETGWLGLGAFGIALSLLIMSAWRSRQQPFGIAMAVAVTAIALAGFMLPTLTDSSTALIAFSLAGLASGNKPHV